jgi:hypothetical protein
MAYQRLEPQHEEQIKSMRKDGKSPQEVVDFFKATYGMKLPLWKVSYITGKHTKGVATVTLGKKSKRDKKWQTRKDAAEAVQDEDVDVKELVALLTQIDAGYKALLAHFKNTLKQLRGELIKSRGQVYTMMQNAGIDLVEEKNT